MEITTASAPMHVRAGEGEAHWWFHGGAQLKATAEQTGGLLSVMEVVEPEGGGPMHVHHGEDEGFWILEGRFRFQVGEERFDAGPGDFVWGPRDVPHGFECVEGPGRMIFLFVPGGFERFIRDTADPAPSLSLPPEGRGEVDPERLEPALKRIDAEILA